MAYGIDYSNFPSPYYYEEGGNNEYGEANLNPYVSIYGLDIYENRPSSTANRNSIHRFVLNVAPLSNETYPHSGNAISLVNLDTIQLYIKKPGDYKFGSDYEPPEENQDADSCLDKYPSNYDSAPIPIKGAPIEFRKVFFQGIPRNEDGASPECQGETSSVENYYAYFACSKPIKQDCTDSQSIGCTYNPRNEYFNFIEGEVSDWKNFDVGGGGGSAGQIGCPLDIVLQKKTRENEDYWSTSVRLGTIGGYAPSNWHNIEDVDGTQTKYLVAKITAAEKNIQTVTLDFKDRADGCIKTMESNPPAEFEIIIGALIPNEKTDPNSPQPAPTIIRAIGCGSLSVQPLLVGDNCWTWDVSIM